MYKDAEITVPLGFLPFGKDLGLKAFGSVGNLYMEHYAHQRPARRQLLVLGDRTRARVFQLDLALSYVDTSLDVAGCDNSRNCEGRVVFKMSKTF